MKRSSALKWGALAAGLAVAIAIPYITTAYYVSLASLVLIAAILASSVNILVGHGGLLSMGHAGIAASAAYGTAWAVHQGWDLAGQLMMAVILTLVVSFIFGVVSMRTNGIYFIMVTLALGMVVFGLAYRLAPITGGENGLVGITRPSIFADYWSFYFFTLVVFVLVTWGLWIVARSPFGTTLKGLRDSESRMHSLGYRVSRYKLMAMMISGSVAGMAGLLSVWHSQFVSPTSAGFHRSALAVVMVILGGVGTTFGPLIGATIVVWVEHVLSTSLERWPTFLGLLFILVIVFAPKGIAGTINEIRSGRSPWRRWRRGPDKSGSSDKPKSSPGESQAADPLLSTPATTNKSKEEMQ